MSLRGDQIEELQAMVRREAFRAASFTRPRRDVVEDLESEGWLAVLQDIERFDPSRGRSLPVFMFKRVRGAMLNWLRWKWSAGILDRPGMKPAKLVGDWETALRHMRGRVQPADEAAAVSEQFNGLLAACRTAREQAILMAMRDGYNQRDIAKALGVTQTRVSQIRIAIIRRATT